MTRGGALDLYRTGLHPCPYLSGHQAATLFVDPGAALDPALYEQLLQQGFRRSGEHVYRPDCPGCARCVSTRLPVIDFRPKRSQRRAWDALGERLEVIERPPRFDPAHFALYQHYLDARHPDGGMAGGGPESYCNFLIAGWSDTLFLETRLEDKLLAVAVTDRTPRALSAVYTFFDPSAASLSPGVVCILLQIHQALAEDKDWLYLGYWVPGCRRMEYKTEYRPIELWLDGRWRLFKRGQLPRL
jgi:arginyl-tRNA--protein-N-Asp/Glu arginylyltransferase